MDTDYATLLELEMESLLAAAQSSTKDLMQRLKIWGWQRWGAPASSAGGERAAELYDLRHAHDTRIRCSAPQPPPAPPLPASTSPEPDGAASDTAFWAGLIDAASNPPRRHLAAVQLDVSQYHRPARTPERAVSASAQQSKGFAAHHADRRPHRYRRPLPRSAPQPTPSVRCTLPGQRVCQSS